MAAAWLGAFGGAGRGAEGAGGLGLTHVGREGALVAADVEREEALKRAADLENWPRNARMTLAPVVEGSMLAENKAITQEHRSYGVVILDDTACGTMEVEWRRAVEAAEVPTELPATRRLELERRLAAVPAEARERGRGTARWRAT